MNALHKHHYDLALATCSLVPNSGPILVKDQMEDWSAAEANSFEEAIEKCGKDFGEIQKEHVSRTQTRVSRGWRRATLDLGLVALEESEGNRGILLHVENNGSLRRPTSIEVSRTGE